MAENEENGGVKKEGEDSDSDDDSEMEEIKWSKSSKSHALIGQVLFRPPYSPLRPPSQDGANANDVLG